MDARSIKKRVVGVDISGDKTTFGIVDVRGNIIARNEIFTHDYPEIHQFVYSLSEAIVRMAEENGGSDTIRSIGISCPSASYVSGCIENAAHLPWKGIVPLANIMRDTIGQAVAVGNDVHASALGEKMYGLAHGLKTFIVAHLGIGLGSCFFSEGHEHQGKGGYGGEIGHTCIRDHGRHCSCGLKGCLETYTAADGIVQTARELMQESDAPSLMRNVEELSPRIIASLCDKGDALAIETYRRTGYLLGIGFATYASVIDPEAIILTGGISKAGHWLLDPTIESFEDHVFRNMRDKVKILVSEFDDIERDMLGASALAWEVPEYSLFK